MTNATRKFEHGVETYKNISGQLHSPNNDTPARTSQNRFGQPLKEFYQNGELNRADDLPAFVGFLDQRGKTLFVTGWFSNGRAHREGDKPTAIEHNITDDIVIVTYSKNGILHRDPKIGPAAYQYRVVDGKPVVSSCSFFEHGKQLGSSQRVTNLVPNAISFDTEFGEKVFHGLECPHTAVEPVKEIVVEPKAPDLTIAPTPVEPAPVQVNPETVGPHPKNKGGRPKGSKTKKKAV